MAKAKADLEKKRLDTMMSLMAGETSLSASEPLKESSYPKKFEETARQKDDLVIPFSGRCEIVMVGSIKSCQHGILCKERK